MVMAMSVLFAASVSANEAPQAPKPVDASKSTVLWKGKKVLGAHDGNIKIKSGSLDFTGDKLTGGTFVIDMKTINCTDLSGDAKKNLEGHLMSDDFFGVEKFPDAKFTIKKVASRGTDGDFTITGDITIKGKTKEIKFPAKIGKNSAEAKLVLDRSEFDIRYGSGSFFDNLGDKTIYDEFELDIKLMF